MDYNYAVIYNTFKNNYNRHNIKKDAYLDVTSCYILPHSPKERTTHIFESSCFIQNDYQFRIYLI